MVLFITSGPSPGGQAPLCSAGHSLQLVLPGGGRPRGRGALGWPSGGGGVGGGSQACGGVGGAEAARADKGRGRSCGETVRDAASFPGLC